MCVSLGVSVCVRVCVGGCESVCVCVCQCVSVYVGVSVCVMCVSESIWFTWNCVYRNDGEKTEDIIHIFNNVSVYVCEYDRGLTVYCSFELT